MLNRLVAFGVESWSRNSKRKIMELTKVAKIRVARHAFFEDVDLCGDCPKLIDISRDSSEYQRDWLGTERCAQTSVNGTEKPVELLLTWGIVAPVSMQLLVATTWRTLMRLPLDVIERHGSGEVRRHRTQRQLSERGGRSYKETNAVRTQREYVKSSLRRWQS